jgi:hypothetical protein
LVFLQKIFHAIQILLSAKEGRAQLSEEDVKVVAMLIVFDKLDLFEPQISKVTALHLVTVVVEGSCRGNEVLLFELIVR